jgi:hypothetical protein
LTFQGKICSVSFSIPLFAAISDRSETAASEETRGWLCRLGPLTIGDIKMRKVSLLIAMVLAIGCGQAGDKAHDETVVSGAVAIGMVAGAGVTLFALNEDGSKGEQLGTATTGADGKYTLAVGKTPRTTTLAETSGGTYTDQATGSSVQLAAADKLTAVLPVGATTAAITPLTHFAAVRAQALAKAGGSLSTAVHSSNVGVASQFGVANIIETLPPAADNADSVGPTNLDQRIYALVLAGLSQEANQIGVRVMDLTNALAEDAKDGRFEGTNNGAAISVPTIAGASITLPATAGTTDIQTAINAFIASTRNKTNVTEVDVALTPVPIGINTTFNGWLYSNTSVMPARKSGEAYKYLLTAKGGKEPYYCALKAGSLLPDGFSLSNTCVITGAAVVATSTTISGPFTVTLSDSSVPPNTIDLPPLRITTVRAGPTITAVNVTCLVDVLCNETAATAKGGMEPYYYTSVIATPAPSIPSTTVPFGMMINPNGKLSGIAKNTGTFSLGVCVVDVGGMQACTTVVLTIVKASKPSSTCPVTNCCPASKQILMCPYPPWYINECWGGKCPEGATIGKTYVDSYTNETVTECWCP